ncbi:unnamed protein product, partial [Didymodactylos carnosus]
MFRSFITALLQRNNHIRSSLLCSRIVSSSYHSDSHNDDSPQSTFDEQRLSSQEATGILRTHEASIDLEADCPVRYYEVNYLGANNPPEDRQAQARLRSSSSIPANKKDTSMYLFGVFDGHGGPLCSDVVGQRLFDYIAVTLLSPKQLQEILQNIQSNTSTAAAAQLLHSYYNPYKDSRNSKVKELHNTNLVKHIEEIYSTFDLDNNDIAHALENAFVKLDRDICAEAIPPEQQPVDEDLLQIATCGSCACVALVKERDLYIANCGDARAIL